MFIRKYFIYGKIYKCKLPQDQHWCVCVYTTSEKRLGVFFRESQLFVFVQRNVCDVTTFKEDSNKSHNKLWSASMHPWTQREVTPRYCHKGIYWLSHKTEVGSGEVSTSAALLSASQLASQQSIPHHCGLLPGNRLIAVVQDVAVPHANAPQAFRFHSVCLWTNTLRVIIPNLMDLSLLVLNKRITEAEKKGKLVMAPPCGEGNIFF